MPAPLEVHRHEQRIQRRARKLSGSLRRVWRAFLQRHGRLPFVPRRRPAWNRTLAHVEEDVVRLHVEQPQLGTGQPMRLAERALGFRAARETLRQIVIRRRDLVIELEDARRRRPRRLRVTQPGHRWGVDRTHGWLLAVEELATPKNLGENVYTVSQANGSMTPLLSGQEPTVGAGVSTCAPWVD